MRGRAPAAWRWAGRGAAVLAAVAAFLAAITWGRLCDAIIASQIKLSPNSRAFREWVVPSVPLYFEVFMFNWTNADQFPAEPPHVQQLGPYRFREERERVNITWSDSNTVSYRTFRRWHFEAATSNGSLEDNITTLNVIAASAIYRARFWSFLQQKGLSMGLAMFNQKISVSKLAGELLFDGYEDSLLDLAKSLPTSATGGAPPVDRFGWFYERNNSITTDGHVEVTTGADDTTLPGQIVKWNDEDHLPYYTGRCAELYGSMGEFLPRNLTTQSELHLFLTELCRSVRLEYKETGEHLGLTYYKYAATERTFDNTSYYHENTCFCNGECGWSGVMNASACRYGSPAFVSLPHFLHADPVLRRQVTGLEPDADKHAFYFAVEPKLGVPLHVCARFQLNIKMQPNPHVLLYQDIPETLFPILWIQQMVLMDERIASELRIVRAAVDWGPLACVGIGVLIVTFLALATLSNVCDKKPTQYQPPLDHKPDINRDEAEMKLNPMSF